MASIELLFSFPVKGTGTLSSESKAREAGFLSFSSAPTSTSDHQDSHIEMSAIVVSDSEESIPVQEKEKPHLQTINEQDVTVPVEEEVGSHHDPQQSAIQVDEPNQEQSSDSQGHVNPVAQDNMDEISPHPDP